MIGRSIIELLLPHRPPFLMVESIVEYVGGLSTSLKAESQILDAESFFSGNRSAFHFPSVYIIEGLGQCCNLHSIISSLERSFVAKGYEEDFLSKELTKTDTNDGLLLGILEKGITNTLSRIGLLAMVEVQIRGRINFGDVLCYKVSQTRVYGDLSSYRVNAFVRNFEIASGTLVGARNTRQGIMG